MKLTNCYSEEEKVLKQIELTGLGNKELVSLAQLIEEGWDKQELQDEEIVIDALTQISEELGRRIQDE